MDIASEIRERIRAALAGINTKVGEVKTEESEIRTDIEKHNLGVEKIKKKRQRLARKARRNAEARTQLKKIETDQRALELETEDLKFSLDDCRRELAELEAQRETVQREAYWGMLTKELVPMAREQAGEISKVIAAFAAMVGEHMEFLEWIRRVANNAGRERVFANADLRHLWRCFSEALRPLDPTRWESFPQYRGKSYSDIFGQMVQGATRDEPADPDAMPPANGEDSDSDIMADPEGVPEAGAGAEA